MGLYGLGEGEDDRAAAGIMTSVVPELERLRDQVVARSITRRDLKVELYRLHARSQIFDTRRYLRRAIEDLPTFNSDNMWTLRYLTIAIQCEWTDVDSAAQRGVWQLRHTLSKENSQ